MCKDSRACATPQAVTGVSGQETFKRTGIIDMVLYSDEGIAIRLPELRTLIAGGPMINLLSVPDFILHGVGVGLGSLHPEGNHIVIAGLKISMFILEGLQWVFAQQLDFLPASDGYDLQKGFLHFVFSLHDSSADKAPDGSSDCSHH